jgi:hypothetical protein
MKKIIKDSLAVFLMLLLMPAVTSCFSHQKLPSTWTLPAQAPIGSCPDISGQYLNVGETINHKKFSPLIYELFTKDHNDYPLTRWQEVSYISIQLQGQNLLNISAWKDNELLYSNSLSKGANDFICEDCWLKIKTSEFQGHGSSAVSFSSTSRSFAKSEGYLLEKRETEGILFFGILPLVGGSTQWCRFARIETK